MLKRIDRRDERLPLTLLDAGIHRFGSFAAMPNDIQELYHRHTTKKAVRQNPDQTLVKRDSQTFMRDSLLKSSLQMRTGQKRQKKLLT